MGGAVWLDNGDGTFTQAEDGNPLPTGRSALDLYVMGMMPAAEVPDTFLLRDVQETNARRRVRATKVPVRIDDIVAAMGPRGARGGCVPPGYISPKKLDISSAIYSACCGPCPLQAARAVPSSGQSTRMARTMPQLDTG